jgi:hypothetical protein
VACACITLRDEDVGLERSQRLRGNLQPARIAGTPAISAFPHTALTLGDADIAAVDPSERRQRLLECRRAGSISRIAFRLAHQHCDESNAPLLLRARRERPPYGSAAEQRDEVASMRNRNDSGIVKPIPLPWSD